MSKFKEKAAEINKKIGAMIIAAGRQDTPLYAKIACLLCVYYALSPLDLVPDFVPVLGAIDDMIILPFLIWLAVKLMPKDILEECNEQADKAWENRQSKKRYAIPVLIIWFILLFWFANLIYKFTAI